jgi:Dicarboxylate carrier protein MatC N-terminus
MTRRATGSDEPDEGSVEETSVDRSAQVKAAVDLVRTRVAQVVWILCVLAALVLAVGALCIALKANGDNSLVKFCIDTADKLDLGVFSRTDGVAHWKGHSHTALTKNACVNWGLAAVVWLIVGKIVERVVRPRGA